MTDSARLHVSGLTPSISAQDITSKLSSFGKVKAVDGFGARDGNGDPRKFAYVTLEAQPAQISRCVSALSGTTWKGTRLRLAPAKPDFSARWALERDAADKEPPKKRRKRMRGVHGVQAGDMAPVTLANYERHRGWYKTPLDHLVYPLRMRPLHPLPPTIAKDASSSKDKKPAKKGKKRVRPPALRARRRLLDPARWGVTHLSGSLLENAVVSHPQHSTHEELDDEDEGRDDEDEGEDEDEGTDDEDEETDGEAEESDKGDEENSTRAPVPTDAISTTLREEVTHSRKLLDTLFGADEGEWRAPDSIDSDLEELIKQNAPTMDIDEDEVDDQTDDQLANGDNANATGGEQSTDPQAASARTQASTLKEIFAPHEEDAGFSLMANLDLDLELDDELSLLAPMPVSLPTVPVPIHAVAPSLPRPPPASSSLAADEWRIAADAPGVRPLFFPGPSNISTLKFFRTETEEQIRSRWEERKGPLTAEWKKRSREAKKRGRRGGVGINEE